MRRPAPAVIRSFTTLSFNGSLSDRFPQIPLRFHDHYIQSGMSENFSIVANAEATRQRLESFGESLYVFFQNPLNRHFYNPESAILTSELPVAIKRLPVD